MVPGSDTAARLATYARRSSPSQVWNIPTPSTAWNRAPQPVEAVRVGGDELDLQPAVVGLRPGDRQGRLGDVYTEDGQPERSQVQGVVAGPAPDVEHRTDERTLGCQTHDRRLRLADRSWLVGSRPPIGSPEEPPARRVNVLPVPGG